MYRSTASHFEDRLTKLLHFSSDVIVKFLGSVFTFGSLVEANDEEAGKLIQTCLVRNKFYTDKVYLIMASCSNPSDYNPLKTVLNVSRKHIIFLNPNEYMSLLKSAYQRKQRIPVLILI